jgi:hypothetical protein
MPLVVEKFPVIWKTLKQKGYTLQVGCEIIKTEIMRETGILNEKTLQNAFSGFIRLGYVKDSGVGSIFFIAGKKPYDFPQDKEKIETEEDLTAKYGV